MNDELPDKPPDKLPAAILAAGRISPSLEQATGVLAKALIPIGGRPIIDLVLEATGQATSIAEVKVVCAAGSPLLERVGDAGVVAEGSSYLDSIVTGLKTLGSPERLLVITGDLPFLTAEALDHFCGQALQSEASIVYSIVRREDCERAFPGGTRTYIRLRDGVCTGGNVAVLNRSFIEAEGERLLAAFAGRKNPFRLAAMLGGAFVLRYVAGRLALADVVARVESLLNTDVHVVQSPYAEIGFDIDKPANLESAEARLARADL